MVMSLMDPEQITTCKEINIIKGHFNTGGFATALNLNAPVVRCDESSAECVDLEGRIWLEVDRLVCPQIEDMPYRVSRNLA